MIPAHRAAAVLIFASVGLGKATAEPSGASLEGAVTQHGAPLHGVSITISCGSSRLRALSDAEGKFQSSEIPAGDAQLELEHTGDTFMVRVSRSLQIVSGTAHHIDFDLQPGACTVTGMLSHNGAPVEGASALVVAQLSDGSELRTCVLTGKSGTYRIEGLPAGVHTLHLDPRPTILPVALARMRKGTRDVNLTLVDGEPVQHDYNLATGRVVAQLKGMRFSESGRFVLASGEFAGPRLGADNVGIVLRHAVASKILSSDDTITIDDLEAGSYTAFFAAFDRNTGSVRQAFQTMRLVYRIVSVTPGEKTGLLLQFE